MNNILPQKIPEIFRLITEAIIITNYKKIQKSLPRNLIYPGNNTKYVELPYAR